MGDWSQQNKQVGINFRLMKEPELYAWLMEKKEKTVYLRGLVSMAKDAEEKLGNNWKYQFYAWLESQGNGQN